MNQQLVDGTKHQVEGRPLQGNSWWILQWVQNIWWMNQLVGTTHTKHWLDATNQETKNKLCLLCIAYFTFTTTMHLINARKLWPRSKKKKYMIYIYICLFNIDIYIYLFEFVLFDSIIPSPLLCFLPLLFLLPSGFTCLTWVSLACLEWCASCGAYSLFAGCCSDKFALPPSCTQTLTQ